MSKRPSNRNHPWGVTHRDGVFKLVVIPHTSNAYWSSEEDIFSYQEGKIGEIQGIFIISVVPVGEQTRISVTKQKLKQLVSKTFRVTPHPDFNDSVFEELSSNTYFEYLFLRELGGELGEKDMPELVQ